ncbi:MAG: flavin monoamine oxidase family protein, partial [Candidatus Saccharimonadales bacterium]
EERYDGLKNSVRKFVWGYDSADPGKASAFALRSEWLDEDQRSGHRVKGGYGKMIGFLEDECKNAGGLIFLNSIVKEIHWAAGKVKAITHDGTVYEAPKVIIALPLGVLQANKNEKAAISFIPPIPEQTEALERIGFGAVIKILFEFDTLFWEDKQTEALAGKSLKNMGFLITDQGIPVWWTQVPGHSAVLTGWLSGPCAAKRKDMADDEILQLSLQSLSVIFKREIKELKNKLVSFQIVNWANDPFTLGSYAYDTVETAAARKLLNGPVEDTLFFAGEYLYEGAMMGTVEAALVSGAEVARRILLHTNIL